MIGIGVGTILQATNRFGVGSGYLCPQLLGPAFLPASLLAVKTGGLALLYGMTIVAGCSRRYSRDSFSACEPCSPPKLSASSSLWWAS